MGQDSSHTTWLSAVLVPWRRQDLLHSMASAGAYRPRYRCVERIAQYS